MPASTKGSSRESLVQQFQQALGECSTKMGHLQEKSKCYPNYQHLNWTITFNLEDVAGLKYASPWTVNTLHLKKCPWILAGQTPPPPPSAQSLKYRPVTWQCLERIWICWVKSLPCRPFWPAMLSQKWRMSEFKLIWPIIMTSNCLAIILSPVGNVYWYIQYSLTKGNGLAMDLVSPSCIVAIVFDGQVQVNGEGITVGFSIVKRFKTLFKIWEKVKYCRNDVGESRKLMIPDIPDWILKMKLEWWEWWNGKWFTQPTRQVIG